MAKISDLLIGVLLLSFVMVVMVSFIGQSRTNYDVSITTEENESLQELSVYNKIDTINSRTEEVRDSIVTNTTQEQGITDILGSLFQNAYTSLLITKDTVDVTASMVRPSVRHIGLSDGLANALVAVIIGILIIYVFIKVFLSRLLKGDV